MELTGFGTGLKQKNLLAAPVANIHGCGVDRFWNGVKTDVVVMIPASLNVVELTGFGTGHTRGQRAEDRSQMIQHNHWISQDICAVLMSCTLTGFGTGHTGGQRTEAGGRRITNKDRLCEARTTI